MLTINLLPNKDHQISAGSIATGVIQTLLITATVGLIVAAIWLPSAVSGISTQVATKKAEKNDLKASIDKAGELQQKLQNVIDRKTFWESTEKLNGHYGQLLADIATATPEKLKLITVEAQKDASLAITGLAASRAEVTIYIEALNKIKGLSGVTLGQANSQTDGVTFSITAKIGTTTPSPASTP